MMRKALVLLAAIMGVVLITGSGVAFADGSDSQATQSGSGTVPISVTTVVAIRSWTGNSGGSIPWESTVDAVCPEGMTVVSGYGLSNGAAVVGSKLDDTTWRVEFGVQSTPPTRNLVVAASCVGIATP